MSELEVFRFPATGQTVRTVLVDGEPWFVASDVCSVLGLTNVTEALRGLEGDEFRTTEVVDSAGRRQRGYIVSEAGLYSLMLRSRKPEAKAFKRWITHEVLPALRKTGRYELPSLADPLAELERQTELTTRAIALARTERQRAEYAERELAEAAPQAEAWRVLASTEGDYSVRDAAYILNRDPAIATGQNRLFELLREWRLIDKTNRPYAAHERHVRLRVTHYTDRWTGEEVATTQVRVTVAGLRYLHRRMGGVEQLRFVSPSEAA